MIVRSLFLEKLSLCENSSASSAGVVGNLHQELHCGSNVFAN